MQTILLLVILPLLINSSAETASAYLIDRSVARV